MKAIVARRYGGPEALDLAQRPEPEVGPTDVLIAVRAASLNPLDYKIRNGNLKLVLPLRPPIGLGCDVAGVVAGIGARVSRFTAGNEVYARLEKMRMGGLAARGRAVRLFVHAARWRAARRARELDRRRHAKAYRASHVSARRVSRRVRGARARPRARQDRRDDLAL